MEQIIFERPDYCERIERIFGRGVIVALTGQRRVGKSCIMRYVKDKIAQDPGNHVIYINKESTSFDEIASYQDLDRYVLAHLAEGKNNYLFIDEVQEISKFEKSLLSFHSEGRCQIMITGSNAKMLSSELSTLLRGRYVEYRVRGLSYIEFLQFHQLEDSDSALMQFLQFGGLPQLRLFGLDNMDLIEDYLNNVFNTIVLRDVVERERIRSTALLRTLVKFLADNVGKIFSARSVAAFLKGQNVDASSNVILSYLDYLCNAFVIDRVSRYNIHGKRLLEMGDKFYFEDLGIRNVIIGGNRRFDIEKVIENAVYRHLVRLGYKVNVGQLYRSEIDFVAENRESIIYVQVAYLLKSQETVDREFGNLKLIKDSHPKYVVTMDSLYDNVNDEGIKHIHLRDFLKKNDF